MVLGYSWSTSQSACLIVLILIDSIICEHAIAGVNGELPMERARQSSEGIQLICVLALEPGQVNRDWKAGEVRLKGEGERFEEGWVGRVGGYGGWVGCIGGGKQRRDKVGEVVCWSAVKWGRHWLCHRRICQHEQRGAMWQLPRWDICGRGADGKAPVREDAEVPVRKGMCSVLS